MKGFAIGFMTEGFMLGFTIIREKGSRWTHLNLFLGLVIISYGILHKKKDKGIYPALWKLNKKTRDYI